MPPAAVFYKVAARTRSVATALHLAGIRALAGVCAGVHHKVVALCRSEATALHLAGIGALARVRAGVPLEMSALRSSVATVPNNTSKWAVHATRRTPCSGCDTNTGLA